MIHLGKTLGKIFQLEKVVQFWNRLPREIVESPSRTNWTNTCQGWPRFTWSCLRAGDGLDDLYFCDSVFEFVV